MKIISALTISLALVIGIAPQLTECAAQGRAIALPSGMTIPMACHWTAQAAVAMASLVLVAGALLPFSTSTEGRRNLGLLSALAGGFVILLPTVLIGVCPSPDMLCSSVMQPTLILAGTLVAALGLITVGSASRMQEQAA